MAPNATVALTLNVTASQLTASRSVRQRGLKRRASWSWPAAADAAASGPHLRGRPPCGQIVVRVGDNVQADVYVALQNALEKGDDLPVVSRSRPVRLRSYVRFVDEANRQPDTTFSYLWEDADQVRPLRRPGVRAGECHHGLTPRTARGPSLPPPRAWRRP